MFRKNRLRFGTERHRSKRLASRKEQLRQSPKHGDLIRSSIGKSTDGNTLNLKEYPRSIFRSGILVRNCRRCIGCDRWTFQR